MPPSLVSREEFFAKLAPLDAGQRGKVLRNPYWRGTAAVRERIEGELDPPERERRRRDAAAPPDPAQVLAEVSRFAEQARSGGYIAGDRLGLACRADQVAGDVPAADENAWRRAGAREIGGPRVGPDRQTGASSAADGSATGAAFGTRRPASSATAKMASALRPCSTPTMAAE